MHARSPNSAPASDRVLRARAMFALVDPRAESPPDCSAAARTLDRSLRPGEIALITGPSGAGKSTLLCALTRRLRQARRRVIHADHRLLIPARPVIDHLRSPLPCTLRLLARAGLGDATLLPRPASVLSDGQRWRLALAIALDRAGGRRATLIADEFASTLDRTGAACIARSLARWIAQTPRLRIIAATAHEDLLAPFNPHLLIRTRPGRPPLFLRREVRP